jgi:hypothetical protein
MFGCHFPTGSKTGFTISISEMQNYQSVTLEITRENNSFWTADIVSAIKHSLHLRNPKFHCNVYKIPSVVHDREWIQFIHYPISLRYITSNFYKWSLSFMSEVHFLFSMHAACPTHPIFLHLITGKYLTWSKKSSDCLLFQFYSLSFFFPLNSKRLLQHSFAKNAHSVLSAKSKRPKVISVQNNKQNYIVSSWKRNHSISALSCIYRWMHPIFCVSSEIYDSTSFYIYVCRQEREKQNIRNEC